jgi:hypothetical protein
MGDDGIGTFVAGYRSEDRGRIAFAWNGQHGRDFGDANQAFRERVVVVVIESPGRADLQLIRDLYSAEAAWAKEAWTASRFFARLGELLLVRGGAGELLTFAQGLMTSFDTFGACHQMQLPPETTKSLLESAEQELAKSADEPARQLLGAVQELLLKLKAGTAANGWVCLQPGTEVTNVRVVPRWRLAVRAAIARVGQLLGVDRRGGPTRG